METSARAAYDLLPTWFNEGVATYLANEPDCTHDPAPAVDDLDAVSTKDGWQHHVRGAGGPLALYCQARREIASWASRFEGREQAVAALERILDDVNDGVAFVDAYDNAAAASSASWRRLARP